MNERDFDNATSVDDPEGDERRETPATEAADAPEGAPADADETMDAAGTADAAPADGADGGTEVEILRAELAKLQEELEATRRDAAEARDRALRAKADLDNVRKRAAGEEARAREAGLDSAVLPVLTVYDDLRRALNAAEQGDAESIVPGVRAVMEGLERNLGRLEIERLGGEGETFDPDVHEALTSMPSPDPDHAGTIAQVFEAGFRRGGRLVRPARVVVYADSEHDEANDDDVHDDD